MLPEPRRSNVIDFAPQDRYPLLGSDLDPLRPQAARKQLRKQLMHAPLPLTCERISVFLSCVCLFVSLIWRYGFQQGRDSLSLPVSISRETLLFSRNASVTESMQLRHSTWNNHCGEKTKMLLQTPMWENQETGLVMHGSVYALKIYTFPLACLVFSRLQKILSYLAEIRAIIHFPAADFAMLPLRSNNVTSI
jgi:hypothetical protein